MFSALTIGASALYAAQRAVEVASQNVANATNTSYTRQRLTLQASTPTFGAGGDRGTGVTIVSLNRLRDRLADVSYRSEAGTSGAAAARADTLTRAETLLGPYSDGTPQALSSFLASWDSLSTSPDDSSARTSVLSAGSALADGMRAAAQKLDDVAGEVGLRVADDVNELGGLLRSVGDLNAAVVKAQSESRQPNDLLDQRDEALDRIAALTGAKTYAQPDGSVTVTTNAGVVLVNGQRAATVAASGSPVGISVDGSPAVLAGEIGGYVSAAATDLPAYRAQLDAVATQLRDVVNTAHRAAYGGDGGTGRDFFSGTGAADLAVSSALTPTKVAVATSLAAGGGASVGDGNGALAVAAALRTTRDGSGQSVGDLLRAVGSRVGQAATDATRGAKTAASSLLSAQAARASADGVSVDEEMVDLVKFKRSYDAAARVITIADGMLDKLINEMVR